MSIPYKINVNDTFYFDVENESVAQLDAVTVETNKFHILHQNLPYKAEIVSSDFNQKPFRYDPVLIL